MMNNKQIAKLPSTDSIAFIRWVRLATFTLLLGLFTSCAKPEFGASTPTSTQLTQAIPAITDSVAASQDLTATSLPINTLSPTKFSVTHVRVPSETDGREVVTAFWSRDEPIIYYALADDIADALIWFEHQLENGQGIQDKQLSSPPTIIYTPNLTTSGVYFEYQGLISPSQRYRLQITRTDNYSLYLLDSVEQSQVKLLETPDMNFRGAYWIPGEKSVVFGLGPEYGTELYLYHIRDKELLSFAELIGYTDPNISEWVLSPDGKYVAILDGNQNLKLLSLDGSFSTTIPDYSSNVRWAGNSQKIYYYSGIQLYDPISIGNYDVATRTATDAIPLSELEKLGVDSNGFFDVSPNGAQLVFWQARDIWLLSVDN